MTTLDHRPQPTTIDGELIYKHAAQVPPANPHRFAVWASALTLVGATAGTLAQFDGDGSTPVPSVLALTVAFLLFLSCLFRFGDRAKAGDR